MLAIKYPAYNKNFRILARCLNDTYFFIKLTCSSSVIGISVFAMLSLLQVKKKNGYTTLNPANGIFGLRHCPCLPTAYIYFSIYQLKLQCFFQKMYLNYPITDWTIPFYLSTKWHSLCATFKFITHTLKLYSTNANFSIGLYTKIYYIFWQNKKQVVSQNPANYPPNYFTLPLPMLPLQILHQSCSEAYLLPGSQVPPYPQRPD